MNHKIRRAISVYKERGFPTLMKKGFSLVSTTILLPFQVTVFLASKFVPKDENIWIFGYGQGEEFTDNSKHLFLYTSENTDKKAVWLTKDSDIVKLLEDYKCYSFNSLNGIYYTLRCKYAFVSNGRSDVPWWLTGKTDIVMLQHGIPVGKAYWDDETKVSKYGPIRRIFKENIGSNFDYSISTSDFMKEYICRYCALGSDQVFVTGMPRLDMFDSPEYDYTLGSQEMTDILQEIDSSKDIILYAPTWSKNSSTSIDEETLVRLDDFMEEINSVLVVRPHRNDQFEKNMDDLSNTLFLDQGTDFYPIFLHLDLIITNYSSIFWDALYSTIPIVFFLPDELKGEKFDKIYFDYDSLPGYKATSYSDLKRAIKDIINNGRVYDIESRREWKEKVFSHSSGGNCKRVVTQFDSKDT